MKKQKSAVAVAADAYRRQFILAMTSIFAVAIALLALVYQKNFSSSVPTDAKSELQTKAVLVLVFLLFLCWEWLLKIREKRNPDKTHNSQT